MKNDTQHHDNERFWLSYFSVLLAVGICLAVIGCSNLNTEAKAEAAYVTFVASEQAGAQLIQSPTASNSLKLQIQKADAVAKPVSDALLVSIVACRNDKTQCSGLQRSLDLAIPAITALALIAPAKEVTP